MLSIRSSNLSPTSEGVETKSIRVNQICCLLSFFLISWIVAAIALLVANRRRDPILVVLVVMFFATQGVGAFGSGVGSDMKGRNPIFRVVCLLLLCGLLGVLSSSYPLFAKHAHQEQNALAEYRTIADTRIHHRAKIAPNESGVHAGLPYWILFTSVSLLGVAVGGYYPVIGILLVESVDSKTRLVSVALLFCMQGLGHLLVRCAAAIIFYYKPHVLVLEMLYLLLAVALVIAIPLTIVAYSCAEESSVFLISYGISKQPAVAPGDSSLNAPLLPRLEHEHFRPLSFGKYRSVVKRFFGPFVWDIFGTGVPWLLFDCVFYEHFLFHYLLIQRVKGFILDSQENHCAIVVSFMSLLAYTVGLILVTRINSKLFQILGFTVSAFVFFGLALSLYSISHADVENHSISSYLGASILYDCYFRVFNFIPNLTTFLIPLEAFPTKARGFFIGLVVFASRLGCLGGILLSWFFMEPYFSRPSMLLFGAGLCVVAAAVTRAVTPNVVPAEEDLLKLDMIHLTRISPVKPSSRSIQVQRPRVVF